VSVNLYDFRNGEDFQTPKPLIYILHQKRDRDITM